MYYILHVQYTLPGRGGQSGPVIWLLLLHPSNDEAGGAPHRLCIAAVLPEHPGVSTDGLQEGGDVHLLQGLLAVVHGHQDVL